MPSRNVGRSGAAFTKRGHGDIRQSHKAEEAEARAILATFDARLTEAERRIDEVLARMGLD
jgi:hypothetical protein